MRKFTREEASRLTGVPDGTIGMLQRQGAIASSGGLTLGQLLAIAVARGLTARGLSWHESGAVLQYLWQMPTERLEANFARGANFLLVLGTRVLPRLVTMEAIQHPAGVSPAEISRYGLMPCAIDVSAVHDRLVRESAALTKSEAVEG